MMKNTVLRKGYSKEFKMEAVRFIIEKKRTCQAVERELGLGKGIIYRRVKEYRGDQTNTFPGKGNIHADEEEIRTLRRENDILKRERAILKKSSGHLLCGTKQIYGFITEHRTVFRIEEMCRAFEVSRSGYYDFIKRKPSKKTVTDQKIKDALIPAFKEPHRVYGPIRMSKVLSWVFPLVEH
jgi:transposase